MEHASITARVAGLSDFDRLEHLFKLNAVRMQLDYNQNFKPVASKILTDLNFGLVVIAEHGKQIVGYVMFTYEWSDWRDGVFLWI